MWCLEYWVITFWIHVLILTSLYSQVNFHGLALQWNMKEEKYPYAFVSQDLFWKLSASVFLKTSFLLYFLFGNLPPTPWTSGEADSYPQDSGSLPHQAPYAVLQVTGIASGSVQNLRPMRTNETWLRSFGLIIQGSWIWDLDLLQPRNGKGEKLFCCLLMSRSHTTSLPLDCFITGAKRFCSREDPNWSTVIWPFRSSIVSWEPLFGSTPVYIF